MCGRLSIRTPGSSIEFADEIERLANIIPHDVAGLCLDTGHLYYAGMDPLDWLDRYYHRLDYLHFKDVDPQVYQRAIHEGIDFFTACAERVMCPLGSGAIDYPAIKDFLARRGYQGWITIEQERDPRRTCRQPASSHGRSALSARRRILTGGTT